MKVLLIVIFVSVIGYAQIQSDYDKSIDFASYKTYSFEGWEKNSDQVLTDFDKKRITDAIQSELTARGMSMVDSGADVAVTLYVVVNKKTSKTAYTDFNGSLGYGGRWGWGWGLAPGMVSATTTFDEDDYMEGTLVVDMYDGQTKKLAWQGVITSVVKEKAEQRDKSIPKKIKKLMKKYPVKPME
ncbi:DUF4136 domain-containing protein [Galbibacter sp. PAP.153]|uniref:DUF4136 domain-containing protein n=1 Tax=Galbibacter sp. PAP.153 TaxID=3104623 RepID=UPI003008322F